MSAELDIRDVAMLGDRLGRTTAMVLRFFGDISSLRECHRLIDPGGPLELSVNGTRDEETARRLIREHFKKLMAYMDDTDAKRRAVKQN